MLMNLHKKLWTRGLSAVPGEAHVASNVALLDSVAAMSDAYAKRVAEEENKTAAQLAVLGVGKVDPKKKVRGGGMRYMERGSAGAQTGAPRH